MDYNSRQTRQRYIHKQRLTNLCTPAHSQVCTQSPSKALWTTQMLSAIPCVHANTHKHTERALTWAQRGRWGKQTQSRYCLGPISPRSPGAPCCTCVCASACVCVREQAVYLMLSWHCLQWKELHFNSIMKKKRQRGGRWRSMLMPLCEGTLTSAHTAKQLGELNYSTRGESRRMGQEKGGGVRKTHTNTH